MQLGSRFLQMNVAIESTQCGGECHSSLALANLANQDHTSMRKDIQTSQGKTFFHVIHVELSIKQSLDFEGFYS